MTQTEDYWSVTCFNSKIDDAKMDRVLSLWNWLDSQEGTEFRWMGFEGKDFTKNTDGTYKILWAPDPAVPGGYINPYREMRFNEFGASAQDPPGNPADLPYGKSQDQEVWDYMAKNPVGIKPFDYNVSFFSAPNKDKYGTYGADVKSKLIELLQSSSDIGADWDAFVQSMMPKVQPILDEINNGVK
jgi:putative aldouronate transport system substrate-binding protein